MLLTLQQAYSALLLNPERIFLAYWDRKKEFWICEDNFNELGFFRNLHIFPGSWNPWHEGHENIWKSIRIGFLGKKILEISLARRNKDFLTQEDLERRIKQLDKKKKILVTNQIFMYQKERVISHKYNREINFHMGIDTAERLLSDSYAGAFEFANFTVYPREDRDLNTLIKTLGSVPDNFKAGNLYNNEAKWKSSTALREKGF